jgi:hypothetical protein
MPLRAKTFMAEVDVDEGQTFQPGVYKEATVGPNVLLTSHY